MSSRCRLDEADPSRSARDESIGHADICAYQVCADVRDGLVLPLSARCRSALACNRRGTSRTFRRTVIVSFRRFVVRARSGRAFAERLARRTATFATHRELCRNRAAVHREWSSRERIPPAFLCCWHRPSDVQSYRIRAMTPAFVISVTMIGLNTMTFANVTLSLAARLAVREGIVPSCASPPLARRRWLEAPRTGSGVSGANGWDEQAETIAASRIGLRTMPPCLIVRIPLPSNHLAGAQLRDRSRIFRKISDFAQGFPCVLNRR